MEDTQTSEAHMDKCCDICGDLGVTDAIVTCTRCKVSCEHLYCMRTCRLDYPESWYCEKCEDLIKASSLNKPGKLQCDSARPNKLLHDLRRNTMDREKKIQTAKVKPISAEEVIVLSSGAKRSCSPTKASFQPSTILRKRRSTLEKNPVMTGGIPPKSNSHLVPRNPPLELAKQLRRPIAQQQVAQSSRGLKEKDDERTPLLKHTREECIQKGQPMSAFEDNAATKSTQITVGKPVKAASPMRADQPNVNSGIAVSSNFFMPIVDPKSASPLNAPSKVGKCLYTPASDASWKGSFNVLLNGPKQWEVSGAFQAHPPSRVRKKVYESSKLMPEVLKFELVQRGSLWTSLFENYSPDSRDIGIYFLPGTSERCKNYMLLLEHIGDQDLVLRSHMDDLELLIFTSKILHVDCQRWNGMYFLWGLFRCIKLTFTPMQVEVNHCHDEGDNNNEVDMDIDMIGGQNVGRLDVPVPRKPLQLPPPKQENEAFSGIPPGFERTYQPMAHTSSADIPPGFERTYSRHPSWF